MRKAYEISFARSNIMAGFRRAGLRPLDVSCLLDTPRPASAACGAPIISVESLEKAYQENRLELRNATLGTDAKMLDCGYVNSQNGCVMTSGTVLELMQKKECEQRKKREEGERVVLGRELKIAKRRSKALLEVERMREAQLSCRAELAGRSVQQFSAGVQSLKERRAAAKIRVLNKEAQH